MTSQITLKKYQLEDFEVYKQLVSDDEVMHYISGKGLSEREAKEKFHSILIINNQEVELGTFKVLNAENLFIGDCKLERYKHNNALLEIGYILKRDYWQMGYGTIICEKLLQLAKEFDPKLQVIGIIDPENIASRKLLEKFGFKSYFIGIEDDLPTEKLILTV
ncbi:GNAT family N-acetyltransferase [Sphingobacterium sp. HJSM2_6]|uniref:GNAT family N-acetyltransferase n=1 Tax=Sphingobacterium sp. HJSM2_6 TaxID=3366264 RepID=UPI003BCE0351